jgi:hypothetical protein
MLIDQLAPHLPKHNEEVNAHVKCLQAMLDATTVKYEVTRLTTDKVHMGTYPVVSLHWRNVTEGKIRVIKICTTSYAAEMHAIGLTTGVRCMIALSKNDVKRGTMTITVPSTTNLTDNAPQKEGATQEESRHFPTI